MTHIFSYAQAANQRHRIGATNSESPKRPIGQATFNELRLLQASVDEFELRVRYSMHGCRLFSFSNSWRRLRSMAWTRTPSRKSSACLASPQHSRKKKCRIRSTRRCNALRARIGGGFGSAAGRNTSQRSWPSYAERSHRSSRLKKPFVPFTFTSDSSPQVDPEASLYKTPAELKARSLLDPIDPIDCYDC